jgi:hypothetical protein
VLKVSGCEYAPGAQAINRPLTMAAQNGTLFITGKLNLFRGEKQSTKATKPIAVVGLVTVIESSRRIECEDDDEDEDESGTVPSNSL